MSAIPSREIYERGGWKDGRIGQAYDLIDAVRREQPDGGEGRSLFNQLLTSVENADVALQEGFEE